jgi:5'-methylthioadenosine phosphorylase
MSAEIGIIGGTSFYDPELLKSVKSIIVNTPFGVPSSSITLGTLNGKKVAFLPRHGKHHTIRPTDVNSRANIFALKKLGVQRILAPVAVGSLSEDLRPGDVVFVDQFIDRTTKREGSFFLGNEISTISVSEPMCYELRRVLMKSADDLKIYTHNSGTYVCIEGPRFSTKAESEMHRIWGADVVGMTLVPECVLAREAEICYASIATVTDYDVWKDIPVNVIDAKKTMNENIEKVKRIIAYAVLIMPKPKDCGCIKLRFKNIL